MIPLAQELAAEGFSMATIAARLGVGRSTVWDWLQTARSGKGNDLQNRFLDAIQSGAGNVEKKCLGALARALASEECRDSTPAATWMLTHHPLIRDSWSDAAATRREIDRVLGQVAKGILESRLPDDQKAAVMLSIRAQGVHVLEPEGDASC
jgi:transposase-like protein